MITLLGGVLVAPWLHPYVAGPRPARAQSLPWTPTPAPTALPSATPTPTDLPTATPTPTATDTPAPLPASPTATLTPTALPPGWAPDACEPNDTLVAPCGMPTEVELPALNFVDQSPDVFSVVLKAHRRYTIRASSTQGVDPVLTVFLASATDTPVAENDDVGPGAGDAQVELTTTAEAWYLIQVDNTALGDMHGRQYTLSVRSAAPAGPGGAPTTTTTTTPAAPAAGDLLENNYDLDHAARIAWGVPYDLRLVCPDPAPGACPAGDHDFLRVPVKAGVPLVALTYDLGPGTDPLLTLYRPDATQTGSGNGQLPGWRLLTTNDDVAGGWTLRSLVAVTPDWSGDAVLVVAASARTNPPALPEAAGPPGRYRLIVGSPDLAVVQQVLAAQTDLPPTPVPTAVPPVAPTVVPTAAPTRPPEVTPPPAPTVAPTAAPTATPVPPAPTGAPLPAAVSTAPAQDAREVVKEPSLTGPAVVSKEGTRLYGAAPPADGDELASYPDGARVTLLGQSYRGWVKVQPRDSVTPGWMWGPALRPVETPAPEASPTAGPDGTPGPPADPAHPGSATPATPTAPATPDADHPATVDALAPLPLPTTAPSRPVARTVTIEVCSGSTAPRTACAAPVAGLRVELVLAASGRVAGQGVTGSAGTVTLSLSVAAGSTLRLRIPAVGLLVDLNQTDTLIPVRVPDQTGGR